MYLLEPREADQRAFVHHHDQPVEMEEKKRQMKFESLEFNCIFRFAQVVRKNIICEAEPHKWWPQERSTTGVKFREMATNAGKPQEPAMADDPATHSVAVQLPTFNRLAPSEWFHLADANFHLRGITKSDTKFWYIVSKLDAKMLRKMSSFLAKKGGDDLY